MTSVSVVMGVYNGAGLLRRTIDSILAQTERDFELIVVDDGSTDDTAKIVEEYVPHDGRVRLLRQEHVGLTRALVHGCSEARGEFIARHDAGDWSHPERFARQRALLDDGAIVASCNVRYRGPGGEPLYEVGGSGAEIRRSLLHDVPPRIHGIPHHGSAMFVRSEYEAVGGYREQFRFAQDLDLWIRLARRGEFAIAPEILYEANIGAGAISSAHRDAQLRLTGIAVALRDGGDERALLERAAEVRAGRSSRRHSEAAAFYFVAKCLKKRGDPAWRQYLLRAIRRNPLHLKAWLSLALPV